MRALSLSRLPVSCDGGETYARLEGLPQYVLAMDDQDGVDIYDVATQATSSNYIEVGRRPRRVQINSLRVGLGEARQRETLAFRRVIVSTGTRVVLNGPL